MSCAHSNRARMCLVVMNYCCRARFSRMVGTDLKARRIVLQDTTWPSWAISFCSLPVCRIPCKRMCLTSALIDRWVSLRFDRKGVFPPLEVEARRAVRCRWTVLLDLLMPSWRSLVTIWRTLSPSLSNLFRSWQRTIVEQAAKKMWGEIQSFVKAHRWGQVVHQELCTLV